MTEFEIESTSLDVSWKNALSIWWLCTWRFVAACFVMFIIFNVLSLMIPNFIWTDREPIFTFILMIPVSVWVVRSALQKEYKTFRIVLVPVTEE